MPFDPNDPIQSNVLHCFKGPHRSYRSIGGVVRDTGLSHSQVSGYITGNPDLFQIGSFRPGGFDIYRLSPNIADIENLLQPW